MARAQDNHLVVGPTVAILRRDDASVAEVQKLLADATGGTPSILSWQTGAGFYDALKTHTNFDSRYLPLCSAL